MPKPCMHRQQQHIQKWGHRVTNALGTNNMFVRIKSQRDLLCDITAAWSVDLHRAALIKTVRSNGLRRATLINICCTSDLHRTASVMSKKAKVPTTIAAESNKYARSSWSIYQGGQLGAWHGSRPRQKIKRCGITARTGWTHYTTQLAHHG